jgi:hypothetical protein
MGMESLDRPGDVPGMFHFWQTLFCQNLVTAEQALQQVDASELLRTKMEEFFPGCRLLGVSNRKISRIRCLPWIEPVSASSAKHDLCLGFC